MKKHKIDLLTTDEQFEKLEVAARRLGLKYSTLLGWTQKFPDFPVLRLPSGLRCKLSEISVWLEKFQTEGDGRK